VLRRELGMSRVEHFLAEHHVELQEFWKTADCFDKEFEALTTAGLLFVIGDEVLMAEDVAPQIAQSLGIEMSSTALRRLLALLPSVQLADALERVGVRTSGSKQDRIDRIVQHRIQPSEVLRYGSLEALRELASGSGAKPYGSKDELLQRLVRQFATGADLSQVEEPQEDPSRLSEPRALPKDKFTSLFGALRGHELAQILEAFPEVRQSGTKETRVGTLWEVSLSEATLLGSLRNSVLEQILARLGLPTNGSKMTRIERLVNHASVGSMTQPLELEEGNGEGSGPS